METKADYHPDLFLISFPG